MCERDLGLLTQLGPAGPTTFETPVSFIYWVNLFGPVIGPEIIGLVTKVFFFFFLIYFII